MLPQFSRWVDFEVSQALGFDFTALTHFCFIVAFIVTLTFKNCKAVKENYWNLGWECLHHLYVLNITLLLFSSRIGWVDISILMVSNIELKSFV